MYPHCKDREEPNQTSLNETISSQASGSAEPAILLDGSTDDVHFAGVRNVLGDVPQDELMAGSEEYSEPSQEQFQVAGKAKKTHSKMSIVAFSDKVRCMDDHSWYEENLTYSDSDKEEEMDNERDNVNAEAITSLVCRQCNRVLASRSSRIRHERTQHGIIDKPVRPRIASRPVVNTQSPPVSANNLSGSPSTEPQKKYSCDICNGKFSFYHLFVAHHRIHTGEKPFKCEVCGRCFGFKHHLGTHKLTHLNIKPYSCPRCNRKFPTKPSQIRHSRSHFPRSNPTQKTGEIST